MKYKVKNNYVARTIADERMVFSIGSDERRQSSVFVLNDTASLVWDILKDGATIETIQDELCKRYTDIESDMIEYDIKTFIDKLINDDIIEVTNV